MFLRGADTISHRLTTNANGFYVKFNMAAPKPEVVITLVVLQGKNAIPSAYAMISRVGNTQQHFPQLSV